MKKFNIISMIGCLVLTVGLMQCGSSSSTDSRAEDDNPADVEEDTLASSGTVSAVTGSVSSVVGSVAGGGVLGLKKKLTIKRSEDTSSSCPADDNSDDAEDSDDSEDDSDDSSFSALLNQETDENDACEEDCVEELECGDDDDEEECIDFCEEDCEIIACEDNCIEECGEEDLDCQDACFETCSGEDDEGDDNDGEEGESCPDDGSDTGSSDGDDDSFGCTTNEDYTEWTCTCPGGGTLTSTFSDSFTQGTCTVGDVAGYSITYDSTFADTYTDCIVESCGVTVVLNGTDSGTLTGSYNECDGTDTFDAAIITPEACGGLTVTANGMDVQVGYNMTFSYDGSEESLSGSFCTNPPGEMITFNSLEELYEAVDEGGLCEEGDCLGGCYESCDDDDADCFDECDSACLGEDDDEEDDDSSTDSGTDDSDESNSEDCLNTCYITCDGDIETCYDNCEVDNNMCLDVCNEDYNICNDECVESCEEETS